MSAMCNTGLCCRTLMTTEPIRKNQNDELVRLQAF